jgi:hypothetical protein
LAEPPGLTEDSAFEISEISATMVWSVCKRAISARGGGRAKSVPNAPQVKLKTQEKDY